MFKDSIIIHDSEGNEILAQFSEATPSQRISCYKLGCTSFGAPLTEDQFIAREEHLAKHPLSFGKKWRFWCIYPNDDHSQILATARTIHRDLLIRSAKGVHSAQGYCISTVVTNPLFRSRGLASYLLQGIENFVNGEGGAEATILYSNIPTFYETRGWKPIPSSQSQIPASFASGKDKKGLPSTTYLTTADIPPLCERDVCTLKSEFAKYDPGDDTRAILILPTTDLITYLHSRAAFISTSIHNGKSPENKGAICQSADTWVYWRHDFRRRKLYLQRVRTPPDVADDRVVQALARLLCDACEEAGRWGLPVVSVWNAAPVLDKAFGVLGTLYGVEVESGERVDDVMAVRWRNGDGDGEGRVEVFLDETYAFN